MTAHRTRGRRCDCGYDRCSEDFARSARSAGTALRNTLVERHLALAHRVARRYAGRGVPRQDLQQVACVAVVEAAGRFDAARGVPFSAFVVPSIRGSIRQYFRDVHWMVDPPRSLKDLQLTAYQAVEDLTHRYARSPTAAEVAAQVDSRPDEVTEAMRLAGARRPVSVDAPLSHEPGAPALTDTLADPSGAFVDRVAVRQLVTRLPERLRTVVVLRFWAEHTQREIAEEVGCSQMHVSRLLRQALELLAGWLSRRATADHGSRPRSAAPRTASRRPGGYRRAARPA